MCTTSRLLCARWRQRRTIRTSLLSRCVPVARIFFFAFHARANKEGCLETKLPPRHHRHGYASWIAHWQAPSYPNRRNDIWLFTVIESSRNIQRTHKEKLLLLPLDAPPLPARLDHTIIMMSCRKGFTLFLEPPHASWTRRIAQGSVYKILGACVTHFYERGRQQQRTLADVRARPIERTFPLNDPLTGASPSVNNYDERRGREGRTTYPRMTVAVVIRLARRLDWLSSYRSVSSTISSAMISSMMSVCTCGGPVMIMGGCSSGVFVLRRTFEGDNSDRASSNTGGVTYEQEMRPTCLAAVD